MVLQLPELTQSSPADVDSGEHQCAGHFIFSYIKPQKHISCWQFKTCGFIVVFTNSVNRERNGVRQKDRWWEA